MGLSLGLVPASTALLNASMGYDRASLTLFNISLSRAGQPPCPTLDGVYVRDDWWMTWEIEFAGSWTSKWLGLIKEAPVHTWCPSTNKAFPT